MKSVNRNDLAITEQNVGGIYHKAIEILEVGNIQLFGSAINIEEATLEGDIETFPGRRAISVYTTRNSAEADSNKAGRFGVGILENEVSFSIPSWNKAVLKLVNSIIGKKVVVRVKERNGQTLVIGTKERPAKIRPRAKTGNEMSNSKGVSFVATAFAKHAPLLHTGMVVEVPLNLGQPLQHLFDERRAAAGQELVSIDGTVYDSSGTNNREPEGGRCIKLASGALYLDLSGMIGADSISCETGNPTLVNPNSSNSQVHFNVGEPTHGLSVRNASGTEIAFFTLEEMFGPQAWNKRQVNDPYPLIGDPGWGTDDSVTKSYFNDEGGRYNPANDYVVNAFDDTLAANGLLNQFTGRVAQVGKLSGANCIEVTTSDSFIAQDLSLVAAVENEGSAVLSVTGNTVNVVTGGTVFGVTLRDDNGNELAHLPFEEANSIKNWSTLPNNRQYDLVQVVLTNKHSIQNSRFYNQAVGAVKPGTLFKSTDENLSDYVKSQPGANLGGLLLTETFEPDGIAGQGACMKYDVTSGPNTGFRGVNVSRYRFPNDLSNNSSHSVPNGTFLTLRIKIYVNSVPGLTFSIRYRPGATNSFISTSLTPGEWNEIELSVYSYNSFAPFQKDTFDNIWLLISGQGVDADVNFWLKDWETIDHNIYPVPILGFELNNQKGFKNLSERLIRNPYRAPELNPHIPPETEETWAEVVANVDDQQFARIEGEVKSDLVTYAEPQQEPILTNMNEYLARPQ